ncbi:MAG: orotidine-5'-phosphate decarboxylase [Patulibacter sp.]
MAPDAQSAPHFGDRLASAVRRRDSAIAVGLDPDPTQLWPGADTVALGAAAADAAADAVTAHCRRVLDAVAPACVAVKLQSASFERLGAVGIRSREQVADHARDLGLLVILDAKRGDIDVSAQAYAQAAFDGIETPWGPVAGSRSDAVTVAPYMGGDSIKPFIAAGRPSGGGTYVLVRTSNPGADDLQEQPGESGEPFWSLTARLVAALGAEAVDGADGLTPVGAVVGATAPERLERLRELMPRTPFLLPGVGAQGGRVEDLAAAFAPGPGAALITASRSIVGAFRQAGGDPADAARRAAEELRTTAARLG